MSDNANYSTHPGALDGLALGKPLGGGEHPTLPTGTGSGLVGDDLSRSAVASGVGAGVGAGVGPGTGISSGAYSTGAGTGSLRDTEQGIKAGMGAGHREDPQGEYEIVDGKALQTAGLATGGGAAAGVGSRSRDQGSDEFGSGAPVVTGQQTEFGTQGTEPITQTSRQQPFTGGQTEFGTQTAAPVGTEQSNLGYAAAGGAAVGGVAGAALASRDTSSASSSGAGVGQVGDVARTADPSALKQELKQNQGPGGYDQKDAVHPESQGPHGLVWDGEKYVHRRELDHKGSTGVPLQ